MFTETIPKKYYIYYNFINLTCFPPKDDPVTICPVKISLYSFPLKQFNKICCFLLKQILVTFKEI